MNPFSTLAEPDSSAVAPSDPVRPGDAVTEETCPVPWDSEMKTCPGGHSVCCARAAPHRYEPPFNGNRVEEHEGNAEELSADKHVYSFFMKVGSPDAGSQYCAVAACEERFTANETQLDTEGKYHFFCVKTVGGCTIRLSGNACLSFFLC